MPLIPHSSAKPVAMLPGVVRRTLTDGDRLMLIEFTLDKGAVLSWHTHPHEQTGYLISGSLLFELGDHEKREMNPGDSWLIPSNVPHQATALQPSLGVDIFSPPREEYR